jgi:hypothetical protein
MVSIPCRYFGGSALPNVSLTRRVKISGAVLAIVAWAELNANCPTIAEREREALALRYGEALFVHCRFPFLLEGLSAPSRRAVPLTHGATRNHPRPPLKLPQ